MIGLEGLRQETFPVGPPPAAWTDAAILEALAAGLPVLLKRRKDPLDKLRDNLDQLDPSLPVGHPFSGVQSDVYWSSTTHLGSYPRSAERFSRNAETGRISRTPSSA